MPCGRWAGGHPCLAHTSERGRRGAQLGASRAQLAAAAAAERARVVRGEGHRAPPHGTPTTTLRPVCAPLPDYHPNKHERMKAVMQYYLQGDKAALKPFPGGSEPGS